MSTVLVSYYMCADSLVYSVRTGVFPDMSFTFFQVISTVVSLLVFFVTALLFRDDREPKNFAEKMGRGVAFRSITKSHLTLVLVLTVMMTFQMFTAHNIRSPYCAALVIVIVLSNLVLPIVLIMRGSLNPDPAFSDKALAEKGVDVDFSVVLTRPEFYFYQLVMMVVFGANQLLREKANQLSETAEDEIFHKELFGVFELVGTCSVGFAMTIFRAKVAPTAFLTWMTVLTLFAHLLLYVNLEMSLSVGTALASFATGGMLTVIVTFVHEEYGPTAYATVFNALLTAAFFGFVAFELSFDAVVAH